MITMSALSTEYVRALVSVSKDGLLYDPTPDVVAIAVPATGVAPVTWYTAAWSTVGRTHFAEILVGPASGVVTLTAGVYDLWLKVTDNPEVPVLKFGSLTIS